MFAYCGDNPGNNIDIKGEYPRHTSIPNPNAMTPDSGTLPFWGPLPWDEDGHLKDTPLIRYREWKDRATEKGIVHLGEGGEDIVSGVLDIAEGVALLLAPAPTVVDDIKGVVRATYGVLEFVGGIAKIAIGLIRWDRWQNENH